MPMRKIVANFMPIWVSPLQNKAKIMPMWVENMPMWKSQVNFHMGINSSMLPWKWDCLPAEDTLCTTSLPLYLLCQVLLHTARPGPVAGEQGGVWLERQA